MRKYKKYAGADEKTPSIPQYFSWINNTNEGSTEKQTLTNLAFFKYMHGVFGMQLRIYAWDAGNFDGASGTYGDIKSEKFRGQYPNGYAKIVEAASKLGIRMGLWGSPDGYGDTEETEKARYDFFVHLCRDYRFALFKLDGVCGTLRPEKAELFGEMLADCRKYSPDLVVLNHRLNFYEAEKYITTFLWNGGETYTDVLINNECTAMHNRAYMFTRGHTDGLKRLAEDHGVCISSEIDYFEDELIYQAFGRCLILAPEIYGNPWLMRDGELPRLARVYNLHRRNAPILVNGMPLPEKYGCCACSRGDGEKRFITTGNNTWQTKKITVRLDGESGLAPCGTVRVCVHHPYEEFLGDFAYGESVEIGLMPFRAALIEMSVPERAEPMLVGCRYEVIKESADGTPTEVRFLTAKKQRVELLKGTERSLFAGAEDCAECERAPVFLGTLPTVPFTESRGEALYEASVFAADNDSLEARSLKRAGKTEIAEMQACRDAFFSQETYALRGCENASMFDGRQDTFFDAQSRTYCDKSMRVGDGCLRVDLGKTVTFDRVEICCFACDRPTREVLPQLIPPFAEASSDFENWKRSEAVRVGVEDGDFTLRVVRFTVHDIYELHGRKLCLSYDIAGSARYLRISQPPDRIYAFRVLKDGVDVTPHTARGNNMQASYGLKKTVCVKSAEVTVPPDAKNGSKIAAAIEGEHGTEGVYCCLEADGVLRGFPHRAPDYKGNVWEHRVVDSDKNNTFFFPVDGSLAGKTVTVYAVFSNKKGAGCTVNLWLCDAHE